MTTDSGMPSRTVPRTIARGSAAACFPVDRLRWRAGPPRRSAQLPAKGDGSGSQPEHDDRDTTRREGRRREVQRERGDERSTPEARDEPDPAR